MLKAEVFITWFSFQTKSSTNTVFCSNSGWSLVLQLLSPLQDFRYLKDTSFYDEERNSNYPITKAYKKEKTCISLFKRSSSRSAVANISTSWCDSFTVFFNWQVRTKNDFVITLTSRQTIYLKHLFSNLNSLWTIISVQVTSGFMECINLSHDTNEMQKTCSI